VLAIYQLVAALGPAGLEARLAALEAAPAADPAELAALRSAVEAIDAAAKDGQSELQALRARVEALEGQGGAAPDLGHDLGALQERVAALEAEPSALAARVDDLARHVADLPAAPPGSAVEEVASRIDALAHELQSLRASAAEPGMLDDLRSRLAKVAGDAASLGDRLDAVQLAVDALSLAPRVEGGAASRAAALLFAVGRLADAASRSAPFGEELRAVEAVAEGDPAATEALDVLRPLALDGVPTPAMLRAELAEAARAAAKAAQQPEGDDLMDRIVGRVRSLVTIRPIGPSAEGSSPGAVIARAEAYVDGGDLAAAAAELEALAGPAREAAATWLTRAQARLAADRAVESLQAWVIAGLAPAAAAAPEPSSGTAADDGQDSGG
jgi:hypothetical protein